jgi:hypothetical protein
MGLTLVDLPELFNATNFNTYSIFKEILNLGCSEGELLIILI